MRRSSLFCLLAVVVVARAEAQQEGRATLRGAVVSESGDRIPYAVVILDPGFSQRFADENGFFALARVAAGRYRLRVRQVGFTPFDSTIDVTTATPQLRIELRHIAVRLADITVAGKGACRAPTASDSGTALATIFDQLRQNAERYRLLEDRYPFRVQMSRRYTSTRRDAPAAIRLDTIWLTSWSHWQYAPRRVVEPDSTAYSADMKVVHVLTLENLADTVFWNYHCFRMRGLDTALGHTWIRVDFQALASLHDPDIDGSAYLDPDSYKLGVIRLALTHVSRAVAGVESWTATTSFTEKGPSVLVPDVVTAVTTNSRTFALGSIVEVIEEQRLLNVLFTRPTGLSRDSMP